MQIAVTSQDDIFVTDHAGKASRFIVYTFGIYGNLSSVRHVELPRPLCIREAKDTRSLGAVDIIVTGGCSEKFALDMKRRGIQVITTGETDPATAALSISQGLRPKPRGFTVKPVQSGAPRPLV